MLLHWIERDNNKTTDITDRIETLTISGEYRNVCRTCDVKIVSSTWDLPNFNRLDISLGDFMGVIEENKLIYFGIVWDIDKDTTQQIISYHLKDFGIYLLRNKFTYKFVNTSPEAVAKKICNDYSINYNSIVATNTSITRNFIGSNLYEMIMTAYNLSKSGEYMLRFTGKSLNVIKKGEVIVDKPLDKWKGLLTATSSESLDKMINTIYVRDEENKNNIDTLQNKEDLKFGLLSDIFKKEKEKDYHEKANKKLKSIEYKIQVTNFGSVDYITGNALYLDEYWTQLHGKFYIDADTHTWTKGMYTNKLTLNYKNEVDEIEAGQEETKEDKKENKKGDKNDKVGKSNKKGKKGKKKKESGIAVEFKHLYKNE